MNAEPDEREWWAAREIKHLRAINAELLAALESIKWKSMDIDNMEFNCAITYVQMDAIRAAIAKAKL